MYQGNYSEFDEITGWNRFELRGNYDSRLGRWHSADPYGQYPSPFVGMGNNPVNGVDPDGGWLSLFNLKGALISAGVGAAYGLIFDNDNWGYYAAGAFLAGGFLASDFTKVEILHSHERQLGGLPHRNGREIIKKKAKIYSGYKRPSTVKLDRPFRGLKTGGFPPVPPLVLGGKIVGTINSKPFNLGKDIDDDKKEVKEEKKPLKAGSITKYSDSDKIFYKNSSVLNDALKQGNLFNLLSELNSNSRATLTVTIKNEHSENTIAKKFDGQDLAAKFALARQRRSLANFIRNNFPSLYQRTTFEKEQNGGGAKGYRDTEVKFDYVH